MKSDPALHLFDSHLNHVKRAFHSSARPKTCSATMPMPASP